MFCHKTQKRKYIAFENIEIYYFIIYFIFGNTKLKYINIHLLKTAK